VALEIANIKPALTFSVVAEAHLGLAETNGVLAGADAIELLELCLVDALQASGQPRIMFERHMAWNWNFWNKPNLPGWARTAQWP
jgi:hypothetical protein